MRTFKAIRNVVFVLLLLYAGFIYWLYTYQRDMIYMPPQSISTAGGNLSGFQEIEVVTGDGLALKGFFLPPATDNSKMMIVFHGNSGHPSFTAERYRNISRNLGGMGILLAEYRGYSGNPGEPSQEGLISDAQGYLSWWQAKDPEHKHKLVLYGESLGAAVAAQVAAGGLVDAIVMESPFDSALSMARTRYPYVPYMELLLQDHWRNDEALAELKIPKLMLVGGRDRIAHPDKARALFDIAAPPKTLVIYSAAGHDNVYKYGALDELTEFLNGIK